MRKKVWGSFFFCLNIFIFLYPFPLHSDFCIKKIHHFSSKGSLGEQATEREEQGVTWIAKNKLRDDQGKQRSTIIRLDKKKIYILDHNQKTYSEINLPIDLEKALSPKAQKMLDMMEITSSVTDTGETRQIKNWEAHKYVVNISATMMGMDMPIKMEIWSSKETGVNLDVYKKFSDELLSLNPFTKNLVEEFKKIKGYPVLTQTSMKMMGSEMTTCEEVISVEEKESPSGIYQLPQGYQKTEYNPLQQKR